LRQVLASLDLGFDAGEYFALLIGRGFGAEHCVPNGLEHVDGNSGEIRVRVDRARDL
jgi:hypothetical protein